MQENVHPERREGNQRNFKFQMADLKRKSNAPTLCCAKDGVSGGPKSLASEDASYNCPARGRGEAAREGVRGLSKTRAKEF